MNKTEKKVYETTLELFDGCCALCGNPHVQLHHIRYGGMYGGRKTYLGNIIPLCKHHHDLVHTNKKAYMPLLIEIIEEVMNEKNIRS